MSYSDPLLEVSIYLPTCYYYHLHTECVLLIFYIQSVDVRQIYDKFSEKKGGLKELYDKGPQNAFFLVKFWADLNSNIHDEAGAFYGVTSQSVFPNFKIPPNIRRVIIINNALLLKIREL